MRMYLGTHPLREAIFGEKSVIIKAGDNPGLLPWGYTQLEYIESTGTQAIDTGISGGENAEYEIKFNPLTLFTNFETYFGGDRFPPVPKIICDNGNIDLQGVSSGTRIKIGNLNESLTVKYYADGTAYCNDTRVSATWFVAGNGWGTLPFYIFRSNEESSLYATMRLYHCKMWTNGELVRDFIPAKDPYRKCGLFDTVTKTFFTDLNGGNFTGGEAV